MKYRLPKSIFTEYKSRCTYTDKDSGAYNHPIIKEKTVVIHPKPFTEKKKQSHNMLTNKCTSHKNQIITTHKPITSKIITIV